MQLARYWQEKYGKAVEFRDKLEAKIEEVSRGSAGGFGAVSPVKKEEEVSRVGA